MITNSVTVAGRLAGRQVHSESSAQPAESVVLAQPCAAPVEQVGAVLSPRPPSSFRTPALVGHGTFPWELLEKTVPFVQIKVSKSFFPETPSCAGARESLCTSVWCSGLWALLPGGCHCALVKGAEDGKEGRDSGHGSPVLGKRPRWGSQEQFDQLAVPYAPKGNVAGLSS